MMAKMTDYGGGGESPRYRMIGWTSRKTIGVNERDWQGMKRGKNLRLIVWSTVILWSSFSDDGGGHPESIVFALEVDFAHYIDQNGFR